MNMQSSNYAEWVPMGNLVKGLVVMVFSLELLISAIILYFEGFTVESSIGIVLAWGILTLIAFLFWNYRGISIKVGNGRLTVVYGLFNKKSFALDELAYCKRTKANLGRYFGTGVRYGTDGSVAYTTSFGDAVEVGPKEGKVFVFSSKKPAEVCEIINKLKVH
jgi:hypothetical protein